MQVSRPAISYYGSKWRLASRIIELMPPHDLYCEPYGGSASILLQKPPSYLEVYNDLDRDVVNFFRQLREEPDELVRRIELTPLSRAELDLAYEPCDEPIERARRYYVRAWQSRGANARWRSGWRYDVTNSRGKAFVRNWAETYHLWEIVQRMRLVQIECDEAFAVIERFDASTTLFYVDPPYPQETRSSSHAVEYMHEMDTDGHKQLAAILHAVAGGVIVSSYPCTLYDQLYADWTRVEYEVRTRSTGRAIEVLYLSPRLQQMQMPLFRASDDRLAE
jgi:DNA adenine methylase